MHTIPCDEHHVLHTVIHCHEVVRDEVPGKRCFIDEVPLVFSLELGRIALAGVYPLPQSLHGCLILRIGCIPSFIWLEAEFQRSIEACEICGGEETDRL